MALYSVRSDRLFFEMLDYNILFRWFLDMNLEKALRDFRNSEGREVGVNGSWPWRARNSPS